MKQQEYRCEPGDIERHRTWATVAYLPLFFFPALLLVAPKSRYVRYHANQALILFLIEVAGGLVLALIGTILMFTTSQGWWLAPMSLGFILVIVLEMVAGMRAAMRGLCVPLLFSSKEFWLISKD